MSASKKRVIRYDDKIKELPCDQLYNLFKLAGWTEGSETDEMLKISMCHLSIQLWLYLPGTMNDWLEL